MEISANVKFIKLHPRERETRSWDNKKNFRFVISQSNSRDLSKPLTTREAFTTPQWRKKIPCKIGQVTLLIRIGMAVARCSLIGRLNKKSLSGSFSGTHAGPPERVHTAHSLHTAVSKSLGAAQGQGAHLSQACFTCLTCFRSLSELRNLQPKLKCVQYCQEFWNSRSSVAESGFT